MVELNRRMFFRSSAACASAAVMTAGAEAARRADPSHWIWDGVHPLPQGHELIARNWIETVAKAWT